MIPRKATSLLAVALVVSSLAAACGGLGDATGATCPTGSTLTYENFGKDLIKTKCLDCHGSSGSESPKLDTVEAIRSHKDSIDRAAAKGPKATNDYMPDTGDMTDDQRAKLGEWLACGAP